MPPTSDPSPAARGPLSRFLNWVRRGRLEVTLLLAMLLAAVGLWGFGLLAEEVMEGDTRKFDERLLIALRQPDNRSVPIGPHWTLQVARDVTAFGSAVGIGIITAVVTGYFLLQRRYGLFVFVLASVGTGTALSLVLKDLFHRPRPEVVPHLTDISSASFPSGHSMMSSIAYLTLATLLSRSVPDWRTKFYFFAVAFVLIGMIGFSRLYLGVHFPTDVLAGWCIGCTWAVICSLVAHFLAEHSTVPHSEELSEKKGQQGL